MILTCSENKNVTTRMSSVGRAGGSPFGVDYGRGLAILQTPPPALHRPPTDRGVSDTEATPLKRVRLFMGRSDGGLALSPSDLQYSSELAYILECCSEKKQIAAPSVVSGACPDRAVVPRNSLNDKRSKLQ